jgi:ABC-type bacteriocin/lantibiotic exporter with double-glycine peptidase domain
MIDTKKIIKFLSKNSKFDIFILAIFPIIRAIFVSYFFSKHTGILVKSIMNNNLNLSKITSLKLIMVTMLLQLIRYMQSKSLGNFLCLLNNKIKKDTLFFFMDLKLNSNKILYNSEKVNKLADDVVVTFYMIFSFLYKSTCTIIISIITMMFFKGILGVGFCIFTLLYIIFLRSNIKESLIRTMELQSQQIKNKIFIEEIGNNFFLEKLLNLKSFTVNLFDFFLSKEEKLFKIKYMNLAKSGFVNNNLCAGTSSFMSFSCIFLNIAPELKITSIHLINNFFMNFNDMINEIIPLINYIGILKEDLEIFKEPTEKVEEKEIIKDKIERVKIEGVSYEYEEGKEIIKNINVEFKKGINIVEGKSGQGKSTLVKLICGILETKKGKIYYNNNNIKNKNLFPSISYMCQNDFIYDRSVKDNIFLQHENPNLNNEIQNFNMTSILNNSCGFNGSKISGGQSKRISFLRMLNFYKNGNLIILDEPFFAVDNTLVELMASYVKNLAKDNIVIIIDHSQYFKSSPDVFIFNL